MRWYVKGDGDHKDSAIQTLSVPVATKDGVVAQIAVTNVPKVSDETYEPTITVQLVDTSGTKTLDPKTDYDVRFEENGRGQYTGKATITLKGNYSGTLETTFALNTYEFVKAPAGNWSSGDYVMEINASMKRFKTFGKVYVDGNEAAPSNYKVTEGSTIITISSSFMKSLSGGAHTIEALYKDGTAGVKVTVPSSEKPRNSARTVPAAQSSVKALVPPAGVWQAE